MRRLSGPPSAHHSRPAFPAASARGEGAGSKGDLSLYAVGSVRVHAAAELRRQGYLLGLKCSRRDWPARPTFRTRGFTRRDGISSRKRSSNCQIGQRPSGRMTEAAKVNFYCPHCQAGYTVVRVNNQGNRTQRRVRCKWCRDPLPATDGNEMLAYFLVHRPRQERHTASYLGSPPDPNSGHAAE
jgi:hypothetical protein